MNTLFFTGLIVVAALAFDTSNPIDLQVPSEARAEIASQVERYRRFGLSDPYKKLVSDRGRGFAGLTGVRNMRVVLHGMHYRGGANNVYAAGHVRNNENPLQDWALDQLCAEGFTDVVYLYTTNFETAKRGVRCQDSTGNQIDLSYTSIAISAGSKQKNAAKERRLLTLIHERIRGIKRGPVYVHCWNGWHASGLVASLALRQFCGWSPANAEKYFIDTAEGTAKEPGQYPHLKRRIRDFTPYPDLLLDPADRGLICPGAPVP